MRIKLRNGKQRKLINLAKKNKTWKELGKLLEIKINYLSHDLFNEKVSLKEETYLKLKEITNKNYDSFIIKNLEDNWGRSLGGKNSRGSNLKKFITPKESIELAELFGIMLGDGHLEEYKKGTKVRCYSITITGHKVYDFQYLTKYVAELIKKTLGSMVTTKKVDRNNAVYIKTHGKKMVEFFKTMGLSPGNKKENAQRIPKWIMKNNLYLRACLRGLIDTDGSVHLISKQNHNLRICFTSYIPNLLEDVRSSLQRFDILTSKIIKGNQIFITGKESVTKYIEEIGFSNQKHLNRIQSLKMQAPVV